MVLVSRTEPDSMHDFYLDTAVPTKPPNRHQRAERFLRYLAIDDRVPTDLSGQIDTPRLYGLEQLPRALPWETVRTLLRSIDRTSAKALRADYAMFLLIATYGLGTRRGGGHHSR